MSIVRDNHDREHPYVVVSKKFLEDSTLSLRAKGLLAYLLSKPDNWTVQVPHLVRELKEGRDAIQATIKELEDKGYLKRTRLQNSQGRFMGWDTVLVETPQQSNLIRFPGNPSVGKSAINRQTENPHLINNEQTSIEEINIEFKEKKEKPVLKKLKQQEQAEYDEWYESAYALGWVAGRQGVNVILKRGLLAGCSRHWLDVVKNKEVYLQEAAHASN